MTAGEVQEMELKAQTKHCLAKYEKEDKVNNYLQHSAGYVMVDVCMKFHYPIGLGVHKEELNAKHLAKR